jgi:release factor glutamine methyltransferase
MPTDLPRKAAIDAPIKKTLYFVECRQHPSASNEHHIAHACDVLEGAEMLAMQTRYEPDADSKLVMTILTDSFEYQALDQVIPLQPEQMFFMDHTDLADLKERHVLEIGLGSGVLSNFCLLSGARYCSGLEINPRAKILSGFNAILNGVGDRLNIIDGNETDIFAPVRGRQFDFIFSNPPFEPTPPGMDYYSNSAAGIYGLDFVESLLKEVNTVLNDGGVFQMVTMAPGDKDEPFMLHELIKKYLPNAKVDIVLDLQPIGYTNFVDRFVDIFRADQGKIAQMKEEAVSRGVTHLHMLILKYRKGVPGGIDTTRAQKVYEAWQTPLGTANSVHLK